MSPIRVLVLAVLLGPLVLSGRAWAQQAPAQKGKAAPAAASTPSPGSSSAPATTPSVAPSSGETTLEGTHKASTVKGDVKAEESKEGVKTYTFGALELEGRLKSPQILYFLRRVRAQFEPSGLGHRSFLRELADTRRNPAVR